MISIAIINCGLHTQFEITPYALSIVSTCRNFELKMPLHHVGNIKAEKSGDNLEKKNVTWNTRRQREKKGFRKDFDTIRTMASLEKTKSWNLKHKSKAYYEDLEKERSDHSFGERITVKFRRRKIKKSSKATSKPMDLTVPI